MDVAVDPAGHDIKPGGINDVSTVGQVIGQCGDFAPNDADVGNEGIASGDDGAVFDNPVKLHLCPLLLRIKFGGCIVKHPVKGGGQFIDFFNRIVVHHRNADQTAIIRDFQILGQAARMEIPKADGDF